ncbi:MAG: hypothetical protein HYS20_12245 [Rhodocyclales bacterium]|nr:hypothetical protein [Rhodocyclales bacterium]
MDARNQELPDTAAGDPRFASSMQAIMASIQREARIRPLKQIMVLGAARGVGASLVAREAAAQLATTFGPVLVVEVRTGDGPETDLGQDPHAVNERHGAVAHAALSAEACLRLFSAGKRESEGLPPQWRDAYEYILWDVPTPTVSPAALAVARAVDGSILVVHANRTRRQVAMHVASRIEDSGGRVLGVVLNRTLNFIPEWIYRWL